MSQKRAHSPSTDNRPSQPETELFRSSPVSDRSSTFIALYSPTLPIKTLQNHADFKSASHRITGWRKASTQRTLSTLSKPIYTTGSDDDGEQYAGKRLEKVLNESNVTGSLIVARWYGGILLGPVRFTHIENVARDAINQWKKSTLPAEPSPKRPKPTPDSIPDKETLITTLQQRDSNILALRGLLAEKKALAGAVSPTKPSASVAAPNYASMSLVQLQRLEKMRDATISAVLDAIDRAEVEIQQLLEADALDDDEDGNDDDGEGSRATKPSKDLDMDKVLEEKRKMKDDGDEEKKDGVLDEPKPEESGD